MKRRASGFTLLEIMVVVGIIGVLSSVALPAFRNLQLRSKQSERRVMVHALETAMQDLWVREGRYPGGTPEASTFDGPWNPAFPPGMSKRPWDRSPTYGDWSRLTISVEGSLYFSYRIQAEAAAGDRWQLVLGYGDLDGDGRWNYAYRQAVDRVADGSSVHEVTEYDSSVFDSTF